MTEIIHRDIDRTVQTISELLQALFSITRIAMIFYEDGSNAYDEDRLNN